MPKISPSAPASLQSINQFVAHDIKTKYPFRVSKGLSPVFKVILNSQTATFANNTYTFTLDMTKAEGKVLRCGVGSLIGNGNIFSTTSAYNLHITPLLQRRSFDTRTKGNADMVFSGRNGVDYVFPVSQVDCNIELDGHEVRNTSVINIFFTDFTGARVAPQNTWQLALYLYSADE
jgi:hypothetical protein